MRNRLHVDGVSNRTLLEMEHEEIFLVKNKKSRIIMKEGEAIIEINRVVKSKYNKNITLETTAPICSKTVKLLSDKNIKIVHK